MFSEIVSEVELDQINREVGDFEYKYIIYTSLYGGVDQLIDPDFIDADVLYLCFSDRNDLQSDVWKIIRVKEYYDSRIAAKIWKIFGYQILFNNTGIVIWVDASVKINKSLQPLVNELIDSEFPMLTFRHPSRNCIYTELFWVLITGKESIVNILKIFSHLLKNRYYCNNGLIAGTVLLRKSDDNNDLMYGLMLEWWNKIVRYSSRDQLSFNYLTSKEKFSGIHSYLAKHSNVFDCEFFSNIRSVNMFTVVNPQSKYNIRYKIFYLLLMLKNKFTKRS